ncbi:MAG: glycerol-3-phosphate 1-O-acyltransferase PlsY [Actinomycetia bacterium]|nr:glycerol-3-phosphate 1-O-acyltransferase PlsY [Actinomycetes bacterium]
MAMDYNWWILVSGPLLLVIMNFLLGSIPWGLIVSKAFYHTDIREHGSGNIGTTNALRTIGVVGGLVVLGLDVLFGLLAGYLIRFALIWTFLGLPEGLFAQNGYLTAMLGGLGFLAVVAGHIFSPWLHWRGGKGIATTLGVTISTLGIWPALILLAIFGLVTLLSRYVSLGSLVAVALMPVAAGWVTYPSTGWWILTLFCAASAAVVFWAHRGNIQRLRQGTENRIGAKKTPPAETGGSSEDE